MESEKEKSASGISLSTAKNSNEEMIDAAVLPVHDTSGDPATSMSTESSENEISLVNNDETASMDSSESARESESYSDDDSNDNDGLSDYEKLRLERIRRNQEYLSRLGLEEQKSTLRPQKRARKKKDTSAVPEQTTQQRKASLRRKTEEVRYSEVPMSEILGRKPRASKPKQRKVKPERKIQHRMERFIYREFQRIQAERNAAQKQIELLIRRTEKEKAFWKKLIEQKESRDQVSQSRRAELEAERAIFGGLTLRELLKEIDQRYPELVQAVKDYDQEIQEMSRNGKREAEKRQKQLQIQRLCALDIFPKVLKNAFSVLDTILYERFADLSAPQRRSNRSIISAAIPTQHFPKMKMEVMPENPAKRYIEGCDSCSGLAVAHQVGGWISPHYSSMIDRTWPDCKDIHVPQVGDLVLYYPEGHRLFLEKHPDTIGENNALRTPLWKRAETQKDADEGWWIPSWLHSVDAGQAVYPLICRITKMHFEFPPGDPFVPWERADGSIGWKKREKASLPKSRPNTSVRLAISLRPLSPIMPETLPLPPCFAVVWFPSDDAKPFLIPFEQAYTAYQSLSTGSVVTANEMQVVVQHFATLNGRRTRLEECLPSLFDLAQKSTLSIAETLEEEMAMVSPEQRIAKHESSHIVDLIQKILESSSSVKKISSNPNETIFSLIRSTLPLWECVSCVMKSNKRAEILLSPWEVEIKGMHSPIDQLERSSQELVEFVIDRTIREHSNSDLFLEVLTEDEAPSYLCAVPMPISTSIVLRKLRCRYYRSINSILNDFDAILGNCLLYNSPDAPVLTEARFFVSVVQNNILDAVVQSDKVHVDVGFIGFPSTLLQVDNDAKCRYCKTFSKSPYKGNLERQWMYNGTTWTPQTGDVVVYSKRLHLHFVEFHSFDLTEMQCQTLEVSTEEIETFVLWTKPCFPKQRRKQSFGTFKEDCPLLEVGLRVQEEEGKEEVTTIYWRPCILTDAGPRNCGCNGTSSFLRLANRALNQKLSQADVENLTLVFTSLKQRCGGQTFHSNIDPTVTKKAVKEGLVPPMYPPLSIMDTVPFAPVSNVSSTDQLVVCGFLSDMATEELVYPFPELCLDLILYRLRSEHYHSRGALENDIIESFVKAVSSRLSCLSKIERAQISVTNIALELVQNRGMNKEEKGFLGIVHKIRELHAAALASASCGACAVTLFGSKNQHTVQEIIATDSSRDAARHSLHALLTAIARDPAVNLKNVPAAPTMSIKITCAGKTVTHRKDVGVFRDRRVDLAGETVVLKIVCEGRPVTYECDTDELDENSDDGSKFHEGEIRSVEMNGISFSKDELEHCDHAAHFFFGRPGKQHACARCQVKGRSFLDCRLQRRHSNIDFDLKSAFRAFGSVDDLLASLFPNRKETMTTYQSERPETAAPEERHAESLANFRAIYQNCQDVFEQATTMGTEIQRWSDLPIRLSKQFLEESFPVDPTDGRYMYCIICGIGGDLFCCDKCPNVFHTKCLELDDVPAGEWFCEECNSTKDGLSITLPFGRSEFVSDKLDQLDAKVNSLRSTRADRMKRQVLGSTKCNKRNQVQDGDEVASEYESRVIDEISHIEKGSRRSKSPKVNPKTSVGQDLPRRRGRPRKLENLEKHRSTSRPEQLELQSYRHAPEEENENVVQVVPRRRGRPPKRDVVTEPIQKRPRIESINGPDCPKLAPNVDKLASTTTGIRNTRGRGGESQARKHQSTSQVTGPCIREDPVIDTVIRKSARLIK